MIRMRDVLSEIQKLLKESGISYKKIEHKPVYTSEQAATVRGSKLERGAKALVVKADGKFYMLVLSSAKKLDSKKAKAILKAKGFRFANKEELMKLTSCKPGAVPPFGNLFNLEVYLDKSLLNQEIIDFNAGRNDVSVEMRLKDYIKIVKPTIDEFSA